MNFPIAETTAALSLLGDLERGIAERKGGVYVIGGPEQSGRSTLLRHLSDKVSNADALTVGGSFATGVPRPWPPRSSQFPALPYTQVAGVIAGAIAVVNPIAGAVAGAGVAILELLRRLLEGDEDAGRLPLEDIGAAAAREQPFVLLLDDVDRSDESGWLNQLLLRTAREVVGSPNLHLVLTVAGGPILRSQSVETSDARRVVAILHGDDLANWYGLEAPDTAFLRRALGPGSPLLYSELLKVTDSRLGSIADLWNEWQREEIVELTRAGWRLNADRNEMTSFAKRLVDERVLAAGSNSTDIDRNRKVLLAAALEGKRFTAEAVARAIAFDREDIRHVLDVEMGATADSPTLVRFVGEERVLSVEGELVVLRYEFLSDLVWRTCRESYSTRDETRNVAAGLVRALLSLYKQDRRPALRALASLFRVSGDHEAAKEFEREADYAIRPEAHRPVIETVIAEAALLQPHQVDHASRLIDYMRAHGSPYVLPHKTRIELVDSVRRLAARFDLLTPLLWSLQLGAELRLPGDIAGAEQLTQMGLRLAGQVPYWRRRMRIQEAHILQTKTSMQEFGDRKYAPFAATLAKVAVEARVARDHACELKALNILTRTILVNNEWQVEDDYFQLLRRYIALAKARNSTQDLIGGLRVLAVAETLRGDYTEARISISSSLRLTRELHAEGAEAFVLRCFADILCSQGDKEASCSRLADATAVYRRVGPPEKYIEAAAMLDRSMGRNPWSGAANDALDDLGVSVEKRQSILDFCAGLEWPLGAHYSRLGLQAEHERVISDLLSGAHADNENSE